MVSVFDGYKTGTQFIKEYREFMDTIIHDLKAICNDTDWIKKRKNVGTLFKVSVKPFMHFYENLGQVTGFNEIFENSIKHLHESLLDYETIDKMTYYESVIENNSKGYLKSINIKFPGNMKK